MLLPVTLALMMALPGVIASQNLRARAGTPDSALAALAGRRGPVISLSSAAQPLVLDGVTVIDVRTGVRHMRQRVVIVRNRIVTISGRTRSLPPQAHVVNALGKFLIPGLWDMHTHSERYADRFYPLFLVYGVTGIRDASSEIPLDTLRRWRREIVAGTRVGPPRQLFAGPALDDKQNCTVDQFPYGHLCVTDTANARQVVDSLHAAGADFIKMYALNRSTYLAIAAEARRVGMPFGGHLEPEGFFGSTGAPTLAEAVASGVRLLDHLNAGGLDTLCWGDTASVMVTACQAMAARFRQTDTWWIPTLVVLTETPAALFTRLRDVDSSFWNGDSLPRQWLPSADSLHAKPRLHTAHLVGLPLLAGTDVAWLGKDRKQRMLPGLSLQAELALYVANGVSPLEALQAATVNPALYLHGTDSLGTVAPGKLADLVLLDADPLTDIRNLTTVRAVIANGRLYDRATLDQLLTTVQAKAIDDPEGP